MRPPVVVTIAGSDSAGGAGIQADLRTFAAHRVHGATVITVVTAQNTTETLAATFIEPAMVAAQLQMILDDLPVAAVKTGMLGSTEVIDIVAEQADRGRLPNLVVDPVLVDSAGRILFEEEVARGYVDRLFPHAVVVTPNLHEASLLGGSPVVSVADMEAAATRLGAMGPTAVVVKGGRLPEKESTDVVWSRGAVRRLAGERIETANDHGTGCSLAAAIASNLARGADLDAALDGAKTFVTAAIASSANWEMGAGHGPIDHLGWSG
ncbi:MAG: bifunctional hydroxymethylpyrimidine kinase/phosphomethylpyrimidine kinase [Acidimicrobiales bacterium]